MKVLFLNDSALLTYGLSAGFNKNDELHFLPVRDSKGIKQLENLLIQWKPDFALAEGVSISRVYKQLFPILQRYHVPFVYWAIDDPPNFRQMSLPLARKAKLVLTPAQECLHLYQKHGIHALYFNFACNPSFHRPTNRSPYLTCDLLFVGNYYSSYPQRKIGIEILLTSILKSPYNINVYGNEQWLNNIDHYTLPYDVYKGYLPYHDLPLAYSSAKIVLGINSVIDSPTMMSMRTFEALGCGAFFLTHQTKAIENLFKNHIHLVWSHHPDETLELINFYLMRDDLRQKIARKGQEEVLRLHTYTERVKSIRHDLENLYT